MRTAKIPVVLITGWKEDPMVQIFDEGATEEQVCAWLSEEWHPDGGLFKTIEEINAAIDQFDFVLRYQTIKVFAGNQRSNV